MPAAPRVSATRQRRRRLLPSVLLVLFAILLGGGLGAVGLVTWDALAVPRGTLVIENLPPGGSVLVDSRPVERQAMQLTEGRHTIEILAPGMAPHVQQVVITANATLRVQFEAQPAGASQTE